MRARSMHLLLDGAGMDLVPQFGEGQNGIRLAPPDAEGKLTVEAVGAMQFVANGKSFARVRLPIGGSVSFVCDDVEGSLKAEGKAPVTDPLVGTELGGYRLLGRMGAGAVGVVYRALQINLDREVALKMLDAEVAKRPDAVASFRREAQAAGGLTHPHVVQVYDVGEADGRHYYTMELVSGGDLEDRLEEGGPMPWEDAVRAARDCCRALAFAEEKGLVHRDVKPENLMVAPGDIVKLADLGLAATRGMLDTEAAGGTPHFMAPEAIAKRGVDHRSDLYSVGCTLYRLLTGETVFSGSSVRDILRAHRDEEPPTLREAGVDAPKELDELVGHLLAKDPDERYQHANEVVTELEALLELQVGKRGMLFAVPLLAVIGVGAWMLFGPKEDDVDPEPERVVEYVDIDGSEEKLARERERAAYFEALAKPEAEGVRLRALQAFVEVYPEAEQVADAQAEIDRLESAASEVVTETTPPAETEEERAARLALEAALEGVRAAVDDQRYGDARQAARQGEFSTAPAMVSLAETVDSQAEAQFTSWEGQHAQALTNQDWSTAHEVRALFQASIGDPAPTAWTVRLDALATAAQEAEAAAADAAFRVEREAFLAAAGSPVRTPMRVMNFEAAAIAWQAASDGLGHDELAQLASDWDALFTLAETSRAQFQARVGAEELEIQEHAEGRKADLLGLSEEGLRIRVQISGERIERIDPWSFYLEPDKLADLLSILGGVDDDASAAPGVATIYALLAEDRLATELATLATRPNAAGAEQLRGQVRAWLEHQPFPEHVPASMSAAWRTIEDLCLALEAGDDYLALNRVEDLQSRFGLLSVWTSSGGTTWGLKP